MALDIRKFPGNINNIAVMDSYFTHRYIIIKYRSSSIDLSQNFVFSQYLNDELIYIGRVPSGLLGGVAEVVGSNLAKGKIFTASIGSVDSLYPSVFIYCLNLHQFLILCSSKAMMFVKLYFRTSDIYLISLVSLDPSGFHLRTK